MLPFTDFKDGDLIFTHRSISIFKPMSYLSALIRNQEKDSYYEHVCQYFNGLIYTAGAKGFPTWSFGSVKPEEYLKDVQFAVGRYELTTKQVDTMETTAKILCGSGYAWWKVLALDIRGSLSFGPVVKGSDNPDHLPMFVYCSEAVALGLQRAGIRIGGPKVDKRTADVTSPMTLYNDPDCKILFPLEAPQELPDH